MIFLKNDYSKGAHESILKALERTNDEYNDGYGVDVHCERAAEIIRNEFACPGADVHFMPGGTVTNVTTLASFLRPHQAVVAPETGHICVHETGGVEATGHKIIHVASADGKIRPEDIEYQIRFHEDEHYVQPKAVYISDATETGRIYTKDELKALKETCEKHDMYLYMDGARLAVALTAEKNDLAKEDIAGLTDAFYIGGTKNGILFGEALVLINDGFKDDFRFILKQKCGMMAKGWLMGVQFCQLFTDDLYWELGARANRTARMLEKGIREKGYTFCQDSDTNLLFPMFPDEMIPKLREKVMFEDWPYSKDGYSAIRLVTSFATEPEEVEAFLKMI